MAFWPYTDEGPIDVLNRTQGLAGMISGGGVTGSTGKKEDKETLLQKLLTRIANPDAELDEEERRRKLEANRAGPTRFADVVLPTEVY